MTVTGLPGNTGRQGGGTVGLGRSVPHPGREGTPMNPITNGATIATSATLTWRKSRRSNPSGNCVEMAAVPGGTDVAVRNSRFPDGPVLVYTRDEIIAFLQGAKDGDFDDLTT